MKKTAPPVGIFFFVEGKENPIVPTALMNMLLGAIMLPNICVNLISSPHSPVGGPRGFSLIQKRGSLCSTAYSTGALELHRTERSTIEPITWL